MDELTMQHVSLRFDKSEDYRIKEAFKTLRTNIEFSGADLKVIAVTSCTPNEGKSSVAMELAKAFAEAGKRTLLIDADMRISREIQSRCSAPGFDSHFGGTGETE